MKTLHVKQPVPVTDSNNVNHELMPGMHQIDDEGVIQEVGLRLTLSKATLEEAIKNGSIEEGESQRV